ncbi:LapA family protein [Paraglaciecola aestuariivivens]
MQIVQVSFLFWDISISRAVLVFVLLIIGFVLGYFFNSARKMLSKRED